MYATKSVPLNNAPRCLKCAVLYIRQVATDKGLTGIYQSKTPYAINGAILSVQDIMEMCADITQIDIDPSTPGTTTP